MTLHMLLAPHTDINAREDLEAHTGAICPGLHHEFLTQSPFAPEGSKAAVSLVVNTLYGGDWKAVQDADELAGTRELFLARLS